MEVESLRRLRLFVSRVRKLESLSFVPALDDLGFTLERDRDTGALTMRAFGPNGEQVDAFVLTLRLLLQDRDGISIRGVSECLADARVSDELRLEYEVERARLNTMLDGPSSLGFDGDNPTARELLDTVIYGHLAHVDPAHRARYERWADGPVSEGFIHNGFVGVLSRLLQLLGDLASIVDRAILEIESR